MRTYNSKDIVQNVLIFHTLLMCLDQIVSVPFLNNIYIYYYIYIYIIHIYIYIYIYVCMYVCIYILAKLGQFDRHRTLYIEICYSSKSFWISIFQPKMS